MSPSALDGASKYLNNLLLARGFLQDGKPIEFVQLTSSDGTKSEVSDNNATTATVINLIHDLILRRDRDAEQREALSATIRTLRAEESQRILDLQRVQDKNIQLKSELSSAEAQQRNVMTSMKRLQAEGKEFKEQAVKVKSTLDQVRAKAISDIRKRDIELDKLKNHLSGLNRGKKEPATKGTKLNSSNAHKSAARDGASSVENGTSKEWCLENEDNDFLAAVVNETTTENVALRKIVGDSLTYLKTLTGLDEQIQHPAAVPDLTSMDNAIGIPGQYRDRDRDLNISNESAQSESLVPVQSLASSMSQVLSHCQTILRDPSFVPIEEVQIRDEEIAKLRTGWEKMADRWKEAVTMMGQWRQKMMSDDEQHLNIEDTNVRHDFELGEFSSIPVFSRSIALRPDGRPVLDPIQEEELTSILIDHHSRIGNHSIISNEPDTASTPPDETLPEPDETGTPRQPTDQIRIHVDDEEESDLNLSHYAQHMIASPARRGITIQGPSGDIAQNHMPLSDSNANARKRKSPTTSPSPRKRRSMSPSSLERKSAQPSSTVNSSMTHDCTDLLHLDTLTSDGSDDDAEEQSEDLFAPIDQKSKSSRMTVAQKLAAVEAEATEATEVIRRRQATSYAPTDKRGKDRERSMKAKAGNAGANGGRRAKDPKVNGPNDKDGHRSQEKGASRKKEKTDRVQKARDRRRSTLTPAELGSLMGR